jgi:ABC-type dipeptide/oligopeptide/nickel transport system permease subunit
LERPSFEFWLDTVVLGRDIFSRVFYGARISLIVGFFAPIFGMMIGLLFGTIACF